VAAKEEAITEGTIKHAMPRANTAATFFVIEERTVMGTLPLKDQTCPVHPKLRGDRRNTAQKHRNGSGEPMRLFAYRCPGAVPRKG
jgi:hypothetical protein